VCATTVCIGMFGRHAVFFVLLRSTGRFNSFQSPVPAVDSGVRAQIWILFRLNWTPEDVDIYKTTGKNSTIPPPWSY